MADPMLRQVTVPAGAVHLIGDLTLPADCEGVVLFAHGSGSGRLSPRNRFVADRLNDRRLGTLLMDLLTPDEEAAERHSRHLRFDIGLLADRLAAAIDWLMDDLDTQGQRLGLFGASTGGGAAIVAATQQPGEIAAIVSRGGRPDLAGAALGNAYLPPTLLIVGSEDKEVVRLNEHAFDQMAGTNKRVETVAGATHLFEEPGTLEEVARLAADWFVTHLQGG